MDNFRLLIALFFCITLTKGQSLTCNYSEVSFGYTCDLAIDNPAGLDNFDTIFGDHVTGKDNDDVNEITFKEGESPIVPTFICSAFPNLMRIHLQVDINLQEITSSSFAGCVHLTDIYIEYLHGEIQEGSLDNNEFLKKFRLKGSEVMSIPESLFNKCPNLEHVSIKENENLSDLPPLIFAENSKLEFVFLSDNKLTTWHQKWFDSSKNLVILDISGNSLTSIPPKALKSPTSLIELNISNQSISTLDSSSFGHLLHLQKLDIQNNIIDKIDVRIINRAQALMQLDTSGNVCAQNNYDNFDTNRAEYMEEMKGCFSAFGTIYKGM
jgi:hypothetical protein